MEKLLGIKRAVWASALIAYSVTLIACSGNGKTATPAAAPSISSDPQSQSVVAGATATFTVTATGAAPLSYQWSQSGTAIAGATAASYTTPATTIANSGESFTVTVTNSAGSVTSSAAVLTVTSEATAPAITAQPQSQSVLAGAAATFTVAATGSAPLSYQWSQNGATIAGATAPSYTTPATTTANNGSSFSVTVSNSAGSAASSAAVLTVTAVVTAPAITAQPQNQSVAAGATATFTVVATGTAPLNYQWSQNGAIIAGATAPSYTTPVTTLANSGASFSVTVGNSAGSVTSGAAMLTVNPVAPTIIIQPQNQSVLAGATATFTVTAAGTAPLSYQWSQNGTAISGATAASYTTPVTAASNSGSSFSVTVSNSAGRATSSAASLTVTAVVTAPAVTSQPQSQSVTVGATATFTVTATGTAPLNYQWLQNGSAISGATAASYTTPATTLANSGASFSVTVTNTGGSVTSHAASLTVSPVAPTITMQPQSQSVPAGATATFTVAATGTAPLTYQWSMNGAAISGATAAAYTTPATTLANSGASFTVAVSNGGGSANSTAALLTVNPVTPTITTQPQNQSVLAGATATFTVAAAGTAPLSYQWSQNGTAISGATTASYTTPATTTANNGASFTVTVSNGGGSVTSGPAVLTVTPLTVAPSITIQPQNQSVNVGATATFTVTAAGTAPSYQWLQNGTAISGATAASYTTPATALTDSGSNFSVTVSNSAGSVTSTAATLTVTAVAPSITTQPQNQSVTVGASATFTVAAAGTAPLSYQWSRNGTAITGASTASYTTPATTLADSASSFSVTVTNSVGSITSSAAVLTVSAIPPSITAQPQNQNVALGATATFTVTATGTAPLSYQWFNGGTEIAGATAASYTTAATTSANNGTIFTVAVSNAGGSITSSAAVLTVSGAVLPGTDVLTYHNDLIRSGQDLTESVLTTANVTSATFGLLMKLPVDGKVDAQALVVSGYTINGASHNVLLVATENDSVYAYDADTFAPLWQVSLLGTGETASDDRNCGQVSPLIGVTATPVIDRAAGTVFLVAMSKNTASGTYYQRLHALNLATGAEQANSPTLISASVPATGSPMAVGGQVVFDAAQYKERSALLLANGTLYLSWASHCDYTPYTGWIMAYDETSLAQTAVFNDEPSADNGGEPGDGAFWNSNSGPSADAAGNIYAMVGNGIFDTTLTAGGFPVGNDYGNAILKLSPAGSGLGVLDYFTMYNTVSESAGDSDLGSGGLMLLPDQLDATNTTRHLAVGAGKDHNIYLVDRDNMGKFVPGAQSNSYAYEVFNPFPANSPGGCNGIAGVFGAPVYFNGVVYYDAGGDAIRAFPLANALMPTAAASQSTHAFCYPGATLAISANGTANGILWAVENSGVLHAYDATNLATELYNSTQAAASRDAFGTGSKFTPPTVANGKVYVATQGSLIAVFGLL
jgi:hypothetical protein